MNRSGRLVRWFVLLVAVNYIYHAFRNHGLKIHKIHIPITTTTWHALIPIAVAALAALTIWALWPRPYKLGQGWPRRHLRRIIDPAQLSALSPTQFEAAVVRLLSKMGYRNVRRIGGAGDLGVDVECTDSQGQKVVAQCKRYAQGHSVTSPELQSFIGMAYTHANVEHGNALYFTTSTFTQPAWKLGQQHGIVMVDRQQLADLLTRAS